MGSSNLKEKFLKTNTGIELIFFPFSINVFNDSQRSEKF